MVSEVLQDLEVLCDFFLAFGLFLHVSLAHAFNCHKLAAKFVLGNDNFSEGALAELVADTVELCCCCHRSTHLLKVCNDHGHEVLLIFEQGIVNLVKFFIVVRI